MKNVIVVSRDGNAVALGEGIKICKSAQGAFLPSMLVVNELLDSLPVEATETMNIYVMNLVRGITSGTAIEYVKSGKTISGTQLTNEEIKSFSDFYEKYSKKILNARLGLVSKIDNKDVALQNLKKQAYDELQKFEKTSGTSSARMQAVTVDPDKELRDMFDAQIKEAMVDKDMALVKQLMEMRSALKEPTVTTSNQYSPVKFESTESTETVANNESTHDELEDSPINFESATGEQPKF